MGKKKNIMALNHFGDASHIGEMIHQKYSSQKLRDDKKLCSLGSLNLILYIYEIKHQKIMKFISLFKEKMLKKIYTNTHSKYIMKIDMNLSKNELRNFLASQVFINQIKTKLNNFLSNKKKKILQEIEDFRAQSRYNVSLPDLVVVEGENITLPDGTHVSEKKSNKKSSASSENTNKKNKTSISKKMTGLPNKFFCDLRYPQQTRFILFIDITAPNYKRNIVFGSENIKIFDDLSLKNKTPSFPSEHDLDKLKIWKNLGDYENWLIAKGLDDNSLNSTQSVLDLDPKGLKIDPLKQDDASKNVFDNLLSPIIICAGFHHEEVVQIRVLLDNADMHSIKVVYPTIKMLQSSLAKALHTSEINWSQIRTKFKRYEKWPNRRCILFGRIKTETLSVIENLLHHSELPLFHKATKYSEKEVLGSILARLVKQPLPKPRIDVLDELIRGDKIIDHIPEAKKVLLKQNLN